MNMNIQMYMYMYMSVYMYMCSTKKVNKVPTFSVQRYQLLSGLEQSQEELYMHPQQIDQTLILIPPTT